MNGGSTILDWDYGIALGDKPLVLRDYTQSLVIPSDGKPVPFPLAHDLDFRDPAGLEMTISYVPTRWIPEATSSTVFMPAIAEDSHLALHVVMKPPSPEYPPTFYPEYYSNQAGDMRLRRTYKQINQYEAALTAEPLSTADSPSAAQNCP